MDERRFDELARRFGRGHSRRSILKALPGAAALAASAFGARAGLAQQACPPGQIRNRKGECRCPAGASACADGCYDLNRDVARCGSCATACPAGGLCRKGECRCPRGTDVCGNRCLPPCPGGAARDGNCLCPSEIVCAGGCSAGQTCCPTFTCSGGACAQETPDNCMGPDCRLTGSRCADLTTDREHCGSCNFYNSPAAICCGGQPAFAFSEQSCGACGNVCSGATPFCLCPGGSNDTICGPTEPVCSACTGPGLNVCETPDGPVCVEGPCGG